MGQSATVSDQYEVKPPSAPAASGGEYEVKPPSTSAAQPPGFLKRFAEGVGLPSTKAEAESLNNPSPADLIKTLIGGPALSAGKMATNYGQTLASEGSKAIRSVKDSAQNIREGQKILPNATAMAGAGTEFALRGLLGPVGGGAVQSGGEDFERGNLPGFAGDALGTFTNLLLMRRGGSKFSDTQRANKLAFSAGPYTTDPIRAGLGDLKSAADAGPRPSTNSDFLAVTNRAKDRMNAEVGQAMFPVASKQILPSGVANKIRSLITPSMQYTADGRAEIARINAAARDFEKPWKVADLDDMRMRAYARISALKRMEPVAEYTAKKGSTTKAIDDAIVSGVRDTVYPILDRSAGKPPGYFAALKGRQSSLIELEQSLNKETEKLRDQSARIKGGPRSVAKATLSTGTGGIPRLRSYGFMDMLRKPNPEATANRRVRRAFQRPSAVDKAIPATLPVRQSLFPHQDDQENQP